MFINSISQLWFLDTFKKVKEKINQIFHNLVAIIKIGLKKMMLNIAHLMSMDLLFVGKVELLVLWKLNNNENDINQNNINY